MWGEECWKPELAGTVLKEQPPKDRSMAKSEILGVPMGLTRSGLLWANVEEMDLTPWVEFSYTGRLDGQC